MAREKASLLTNSTARKEKARKAGKCQICGDKTSGYSAVIDYDKGKVSVVKAREGHAFYCKDHAEKKRTRYEWKLARKSTKSTTGRGSRRQKRGSTAKAGSGSSTRSRTRTSKAKPKTTTRKRGGTATRKRTPAAKATAKKTPPRKRTPSSRKAKAGASKSGDPF